MSKDPKTGPVFELFQMFEDNAAKCPRTKSAHVAGLHSILDATIAGGMRWTKDDARAVMRSFGWERGQYRFRIDEGAYRMAICCLNTSAVVSIEAYFGREPWMWPFSVSGGTVGHYSRSYNSDGGRLAEGFQAWLDGAWWSVTSVHDDRITLCLYANPVAGQSYEETRRTPISRRTLNREQVAAVEVPRV